MSNTYTTFCTSVYTTFCTPNPASSTFINRVVPFPLYLLFCMFSLLQRTLCLLFLNLVSLASCSSFPCVLPFCSYTLSQSFYFFLPLLDLIQLFMSIFFLLLLCLMTLLRGHSLLHQLDLFECPVGTTAIKSTTYKCSFTCALCKIIAIDFTIIHLQCSHLEYCLLIEVEL